MAKKANFCPTLFFSPRLARTNIERVRGESDSSDEIEKGKNRVIFVDRPHRPPLFLSLSLSLYPLHIKCHAPLIKREKGMRVRYLIFQESQVKLPGVKR